MNSFFEFDFDDWAELSRRDPEAFVRRRDWVVEKACERFGGRSQPAIKGICWRIEIERKRSTSPMQLCLKLSSLMWKRHSDMVELINALDQSSQELQQFCEGQSGRGRAPKRRHLHLVVSSAGVNQS